MLNVWVSKVPLKLGVGTNIWVSWSGWVGAALRFALSLMLRDKDRDLDRQILMPWKPGL